MKVYTIQYVVHVQLQGVAVKLLVLVIFASDHSHTVLHCLLAGMHCMEALKRQRGDSGTARKAPRIVWPHSRLNHR